MFSDPGLWVFDGFIRLPKKADITSSYAQMYFSVRAHSMFGVPSSDRQYRIRVLTGAERPVIHVDRNMVFETQKKGVYAFTVADPRAEGKLSLI